MAKGAVSVVAAAWCVVVLVVAAQIDEAEAVTCVASELKSCAPAVLNGSPPSELCCTMLKEQQPCLCGYIKDPDLSTYINNPNAKKIAPACGLTFPKCD